MTLTLTPLFEVSPRYRISEQAVHLSCGEKIPFYFLVQARLLLFMSRVQPSIGPRVLYIYLPALKITVIGRVVEYNFIPEVFQLVNV